jgi:hypothetical protein
LNDRFYELLQPAARPEIDVLDGTSDLPGVETGHLIRRHLASHVLPAKTTEMARAKRHDDSVRVTQGDAPQDTDLAAVVPEGERGNVPDQELAGS